jgi:hypothetical protein
LEFACVWADWNTPLEKLPRFHRVIRHDAIRGEPFALNLNNRLLDLLAKPQPETAYCPPDELAGEFATWLTALGVKPADRITIAGKNFSGFDLPFLRKLPNWNLIKHRHRFIDPATMWWIPSADGMELPGMETCKHRAGLPGGAAHTALEDALDVVELVRRKMGVGDGRVRD